MAHQDRETMLANKREEIGRTLDMWAKEYDILNPLEEIRFDFYIHSPIRTTSTKMTLSAVDWNLIMSVSWNRSQTDLLTKLRSRDNAPTLFEDLFPTNRVGMSSEETLNLKFRQGKLPYRLREHESSPRYEWGKRLLHLRKPKTI